MFFVAFNGTLVRTRPLIIRPLCPIEWRLSISVSTTAADGLFNLGRYPEGLPAILAALKHPIPAARIRAACVLDMQPPSANAALAPALPALQSAAEHLDVNKLPGIPFGLNYPFQRATKAITGEESYYRWNP